jgi:hypothetical protein
MGPGPSTRNKTVFPFQGSRYKAAAASQRIEAAMASRMGPDISTGRLSVTGMVSLPLPIIRGRINKPPIIRTINKISFNPGMAGKSIKDIFYTYTQPLRVYLSLQNKFHHREHGEHGERLKKM